MRSTIDARSLWYALLAPPTAWALQEWIGWGIGERTCGDLTPPLVRWILFGVSVVAFLVALVGITRSWRLWHVRDEAEGGDDDHRDRLNFMAFGGLLVSAIFAVAIFWGGLSTAFLSDCGRMR